MGEGGAAARVGDDDGDGDDEDFIYYLFVIFLRDTIV